MTILKQEEFRSLFFSAEGDRRTPSTLELINSKSLKECDNLNVTLREGLYQGASVAWFLSLYREGVSFLEKRIKKGFLDGIDVNNEPLGRSFKGRTLLWLLASTREGLQVLKKYPQLLIKGDLNAATIDGDGNRATVLGLLLGSSEGLGILLNNRELLHRQDLNASSKENPRQGMPVLELIAGRFCHEDILQQYIELLNEHGLTTVLWFMAGSQKGQEILHQNPELVKNINLKALNFSPTHGAYAGKSMIWFLAQTPMGAKIFQQHSQLFLQGNFDAAPIDGGHEGITALWFLANNSEGLNFLLHNILLLEKGDLNASPKRGTYPGVTVFHCLSATLKGRQILQQYPQLFNRFNLHITPPRGYCGNMTTLWHLARTSEGQQLLFRDRELLKNINSAILNASPTDCPDAGKSIIWFLAGTSLGRKIFQQHPYLLTEGNFNTAPTQGEYQGRSALWGLAKDPEGRQLLQQHLELLIQGDLSTAPSEGSFKNISVLWLLARSSEGQQLLSENPELLLNNMTCLYSPCMKGPDVGKSAIWFLAYSSLGRHILQQYPQLLREDCLTSCPQLGEDAGKTTLWLLANSPEGIKILSDRPELLRGMVNVGPLHDPQDHLVLKLLARPPAGLQILKDHSDIINNEGINRHEAEELYLLMTAHHASNELIEHSPSQDAERFSVFEGWPEPSSDGVPEDSSLFLEEIIKPNKEAESYEIESLFEPMKEPLFLEESFDPEKRHNHSTVPNPLVEHPAYDNSLGKRIHAFPDEDGDASSPSIKQTKSTASDLLSHLNAARKVKAPEEKRAYFSAKYFEEIHSVPELHTRKPTSRLTSFNQAHSFINLQSCQLPQRRAGGDFIAHSIYNSQSFISLRSHFKETPSSLDTVTFVFAGRKEQAMLPNITNLGTGQRIVMVVSSDEFKTLNQRQYSSFVEFLVIHSLSSGTHGRYDNTGSIQARRLAAFLASWHWQLKECLYLDDNIKSLKFVGDGNTPAFSWEDASTLLQKERLTSNAIISGLQTLTAKPFFAEQDYCYKVFSLDFSQVKTLLMMTREDDVFVLGYPGAHALHCMEDYYFQMIIDFALDYQQKQSNNFLAYKLLALMEDALGGFERCMKDSGIAKNTSGKLEAIAQIDEAEFLTAGRNTQYIELMCQALQHLKKNIHLSFKRNQEWFEKTKKADYREMLCHNRALSASHTFFTPILHASSENNKQEAENKQKNRSKKNGLSLRSAEILKQWQGESFAALINDNELDNYLSEVSVQSNTYPHQKEALRHICTSGKKNGVIQMTTGSGKTRVEILLANFLIRKSPEGLVHIVVPTTQLLRQFYEDFCAALDLLGKSSAIEKKNIIPVGSEENSVCKDLVHLNDIFRKQSSVLIFCAKSYALFLQDATQGRVRKPLITLLDEFHLYKSDAQAVFESELTVLGFSATPCNKRDILFEFSRMDSQKAGITVPLIVDKLPYPLKGNKGLLHIVKLLKEHRHPESGEPLLQHKGIIYVNGCDEANQLAQYINQQHGEVARSVHYKKSDTPYHTLAFKEKAQDDMGILVAVDMLTTGYDDKALSWCLIAKNNKNNHSLMLQISGRVLRCNPSNPQKIGYGLTDCDFNEEIFECHKDREAIKRAHPDYYEFNRVSIYFELFNAIRSNLPFERFESLFTENKLIHHSLSKHLELLLEALQNNNGLVWQKGLIQHDTCLFRTHHDKEQNKHLNLIELFLNNAFGAHKGKLEDGKYALYTPSLFKSLLEGICKHKPLLLEHLFSQRFVASTQGYLSLLGFRKTQFEMILEEYTPHSLVDRYGFVPSL